MGRAVEESNNKYKWRSLVSKCVLEMMMVDQQLGTKMIESYRFKWLDTMEHENYDSIDNLEDYLTFRMLNGGMM